MSSAARAGLLGETVLPREGSAPDADVHQPAREGPGQGPEFFRSIGFAFDEVFTDENATRMIVSDETSVMLAVEPFFQGFIQPQDIADTSRSREVVLGLSAESREQVDELAGKAVAAGGEALGGAIDEGPMYMRGFRDLDGHQWSFIYMELEG
jgi:uncharacterized protein